MTSFTSPTLFAPRPTRFLGVRDFEGWRLKVYSIILGDRPLDRDGFERGLDLAIQSLPRDESVTTSRPGVGFVILHQGRGADYVVLCWWDRENELPMRIVVRERDEGIEASRDQGTGGSSDQGARSWRPARGSESICVWDIDVIWFERNAYVETVLAAGARDPREAISAYLAWKRPDSPPPLTPASQR